jgi:hypothetical protein
MSDADDYLGMARRLRVRAAMMKSREARANLRWLAAEYEAQAAHRTARAPTKAGEHTSIKAKGNDSG